jgi:hypothetical protein
MDKKMKDEDHLIIVTKPPKPAIARAGHSGGLMKGK